MLMRNTKHTNNFLFHITEYLICINTLYLESNAELIALSYYLKIENICHNTKLYLSIQRFFFSTLKISPAQLEMALNTQEAALCRVSRVYCFFFERQIDRVLRAYSDYYFKVWFGSRATTWDDPAIHTFMTNLSIKNNAIESTIKRYIWTRYKNAKTIPIELQEIMHLLRNQQQNVHNPESMK
jgi:hypothetical protein